MPGATAGERAAKTKRKRRTDRRCAGVRQFSVQPGFGLRRLGVLLAKPVNAPSRVDQALLTGVERVALVADVDGQFLASGTRLERVATGALNVDDCVLRVNAFFHDAFDPRRRVRGRRTLALTLRDSKPAARFARKTRGDFTPRSGGGSRQVLEKWGLEAKLTPGGFSGTCIGDMAETIGRREALTRLAAAGGVLASAGALGRLAYDRGGYDVLRGRGERQVRNFAIAPTTNDVKLAIAKSSQEPEQLVRRAVDALGGMKRFISRGDIVAIKPNIGWDRLPVHAANTNPRVVAEVAKLAFEAGAKQVIVTDASCNEPNRCFQRSGIWRAAHAVGATVILPSAHRFRDIRMRGEVLDTWPVYTPLVNADKVINVPVAKHHNLSKFTGGMKNWYGLLGGRRNRLHQNINVSIADLATFMRPTLTIMDATRVLLRNGPQGGNIDDAKDVYQVIASLDPVAADAYGATLIGAQPANIEYLQLAAARGLGHAQWDSIAHVEV